MKPRIGLQPVMQLLNDLSCQAAKSIFPLNRSPRLVWISEHAKANLRLHYLRLQEVSSKTMQLRSSWSNCQGNKHYTTEPKRIVAQLWKGI